MRACIDLEFCPPTYDVVASFLHIEHVRNQIGDEGIDLFITSGPLDGFKKIKAWPYTTEQKKAALERIVLPMAMMLPSITDIIYRDIYSSDHRDLNDVLGYRHRMYGASMMFEAFRNGIRPLRSLKPAPKDESLITITLREADHWACRNSNTAEWIYFASALRDCGFRVVFVRDTSLAYEPLSDFETSPDASLDLVERARLYSSAKMNYFVNNGPAWFCIALGAPACVFRIVDESIPWSCAAKFASKYGMPPGSQLPFEDVHLIWFDDCFENIVAGSDIAFGGALHRTNNEQIDSPVQTLG